MATHTDYFNLEKPESYENYNIEVFNDNADTIDLQMHNNQVSAAKVMVGATSLADGESGRVPTPHAGDEDKYLKGDGTWAEAGSSNVEANPSGTPTDTLETIGIDNVIYQLPEGGDTEITGDAEGSVITIDDGKLNAPLKACTVDINPVQDLHGYDHPWAAGCGKNKLPINAESAVIGGITFTVINENGTPVAIKAVGTATELVIFNLNNVCSDIVSGTQYTLTSGVTGDGWDKYAVQMCDVNTFATLCTTTNGTVAANTVEGASYFARIIVWSGQTVDLTFKPMLRLATETDATFEPYSNICPISGLTEANITVAGKNLYDETQTLIKGRYTSDGSIAGTSSELNKHTGLIKIQGGKTYTYYNAIPYTVQIYGVWFDADEQYISTFALPKSPTTTSTAIAPNNACYVALSIYNITDQKVQFEVGATATEYEAYNDTTYNIEFEDSGSPLTVYGGTLDTVSGVLTVTDGYIASYDGETLPSTWISDRDVYAAGTTPTTGAEVVYKLATPTEVSLTPTEITTLYGNNVIWADSGDMAITYVRDTSIAINDALNQSITPTYSSGTKIADYNIGGQTGAIYVQGGGGGGGYIDTLWTGNETPTMSYNPTITLSHPISDYDFLLVNFNNYNGNFYLKSTATLYGLTAGDYVAQEILPVSYVAMFINVINDYNITLNCYGRNYENHTTYISIIGVKL